MLTRDNFSGNDIEDEGVMKISESLKTNSSLTSLNLECAVK